MALHKPAQDVGKRINPIWRGIGCVMLIALPILAWFAASYAINALADNPYVIGAIREGVSRDMQKGILAFLFTIFAFALVSAIYGLFSRSQFDDEISKEARAVERDIRRENKQKRKRRRR